MPMLIVFIIGWFGGVWWPGIEVDAPPPKGDPWWMKILSGVLSGAAAVLILQVAQVSIDSLVGVTLAIATGKVTNVIVGAVAGMARR